MILSGLPTLLETGESLSRPVRSSPAVAGRLAMLISRSRSRIPGGPR